MDPWRGKKSAWQLIDILDAEKQIQGNRSYSKRLGFTYHYIEK